MSAPVYVGKHDAETRTEWLSVDQVWPVLDVSSLIAAARLTLGRGPSPRHYKPCPDCNDTGRRCWLTSRSTLSMRCNCGATPPQLMNAPVAVVPSSSAVAVKAGGVATLTGGDTTQPATSDDVIHAVDAAPTHGLDTWDF